MHVHALPLDLASLKQDPRAQNGGAHFHALSSTNSALSQQEAIALRSHLYASSRGQTMSVIDALQAASLA